MSHLIIMGVGRRTISVPDLWFLGKTELLLLTVLAWNLLFSPIIWAEFLPSGQEHFTVEQMSNCTIGQWGGRATGDEGCWPLREVGTGGQRAGWCTHRCRVQPLSGTAEPKPHATATIHTHPKKVWDSWVEQGTPQDTKCWGCDSSDTALASKHEALSSNPSTAKTKNAFHQHFPVDVTLPSPLWHWSATICLLHPKLPKDFLGEDWALATFAWYPQ
jgi:hypothetical protein